MSVQALLSRISSSFREFANATHSKISTTFWRWGVFVSRRPYVVICATLILSFLGGVSYSKFYKSEKDIDDLFTPKDIQAVKDRAYIDEIYGSFTTRARILAVQHPDFRRSEGCEGRLLLRDEETARENIQALYRVYEELRALEIEYDHVTYTLQDICIKVSKTQTEIAEPCLLRSILDLWNYNGTAITAADFNPLDDINSNAVLFDRFGEVLDVESILGTDLENRCEEEQSWSSNIEAFAFTLIYINEREEVNGAEIDPQSLKWINTLKRRLRDISQTLPLDVYLSDTTAVRQESEEQIERDFYYVALATALVFAYTNITLFKNNWLACKMHLSVVSFVSIGLSIVTAFGLALAFGVKFNNTALALPFMIMGLGIDDTFVIVGAYQKLSYGLSAEDRIAQTLAKAGPSIFVTSITDFCAFLMGMNSQLPGLKNFSIYAAFSVFIDFAYQVSFFVAFLALEAKREIRYQEYNEEKLSESTSTEKTRDAPGTELQGFVLKNPSTEASSSTEATSSVVDQIETQPSSEEDRAGMNSLCSFIPYDPKAPSLTTRIAGEFLPSITLHPFGKYCMIAIECILIGMSIFGCTRLKMDFNYIDMFTPKGSALRFAFDLEERYFNGNQQPFEVYSKEAAGGDYFYHQDELKALQSALENDPHVVPPVPTWSVPFFKALAVSSSLCRFEGYTNWLESGTNHTAEFNGTIPNAKAFNNWLQEYLSGDGSIHSSSVVFSDGDKPHVISSRIHALTVDIVDGEQTIDIIDSIRESIQNAAPSLDPIPFAVPFLFYDGLRYILTETLLNIVLAATAVFAITAMLLVSLSASLIVVTMVALTDLMLFGYMWYLGLVFNPVTAITLIMAVGISVDYSAHITHSFLVLQGGRVERSKLALKHIGGEVLSGAFTTWLGVLALGAGGNYVFRMFFTMFFAIVLVGAWHGLVILPIVLSFIGPKPL